MLRGQPPGKLKPALTPEHDVHQDNLRPELLCSPQRLSRGSGNADDAQALPFQAAAGGLQKQPVVVAMDGRSMAGLASRVAPERGVLPGEATVVRGAGWCR